MHRLNKRNAEHLFKPCKLGLWTYYKYCFDLFIIVEKLLKKKKSLFEFKGDIGNFFVSYEI